MNTTFKVLFPLFIILLACFFSCSEEEPSEQPLPQPTGNDYSSLIIGQWQQTYESFNRLVQDSMVFVYTDSAHTGYYYDSTHYYLHYDTTESYFDNGAVYDFQDNNIVVKYDYIGNTNIGNYQVIDTLISSTLISTGSYDCSSSTFTIKTLNDSTLTIIARQNKQRLWQGGIYIVWTGTEWSYGFYEVYDIITFKRKN